jgi:hypothetical protein
VVIGCWIFNLKLTMGTKSSFLRLFQVHFVTFLLAVSFFLNFIWQLYPSCPNLQSQIFQFSTSLSLNITLLIWKFLYVIIVSWLSLIILIFALKISLDLSFWYSLPFFFLHSIFLSSISILSYRLKSSFFNLFYFQMHPSYFKD